MMFGFFDKKMRRETAKAMAQNKMALEYLRAFSPELVGMAERQLDSISIIWRPGCRMDPDALKSVLDTNRLLRRAYDQTLGINNKNFDQAFQPILGWKDYFTERGL